MKLWIFHVEIWRLVQFFCLMLCSPLQVTLWYSPLVWTHCWGNLGLFLWGSSSSWTFLHFIALSCEFWPPCLAHTLLLFQMFFGLLTPNPHLGKCHLLCSYQGWMQHISCWAVLPYISFLCSFQTGKGCQSVLFLYDQKKSVSLTCFHLQIFFPNLLLSILLSWC